MMNQGIALVGGLCAVLALGAGIAGAQTTGLQRLKVSPDGHSLVKADGTPFFWMGDTAWWISGIAPEDVDLYLSNRVRNGFNVIQTNFGSGSRPHYAGNPPYLNNNTDTPNEAFFRNHDSIVKKAESRGLYVALTPLWGGEFNGVFGTDTQKAYRLGRWLGARYAGCKNVMWISSGEYDSINGYRLPITAEQRGLIVALARGLREGSGGKQLMTIHPGVAFTSSLDFHKEGWLDFNMLQSGHEADREAYGHPENHALITSDYHQLPAKPVLDGEPFYEDTPDGVWYYRDLAHPRGGADVVRRKAYWAVFAGACGHTYGHNDVYAFYVPARPGEVAQMPNHPGNRHNWKDSLDAPGATQMKHLRALMESRTFLSRVPDQTVLASSAGTGNSHVQAIRASDGSYMLVYIPTGGAVTVNMDKISTADVKCSWFDPRTGRYTQIGEYENIRTRAFDPPGETGLGNDWVLVLEAAGGKGNAQGR